jgi:ABC-2 type transport system permease protein
MISKHTFAVIKREIHTAVGKSFVAATIFIPLLMFAIVGIQVGLSGLKSDAEQPVVVLLESNAPFESVMREELGSSSELAESRIKVTFAHRPQSGVEAYIDSKRDELLGNANMSVVFIPNTAATDKKMSFYSANPGNVIVRTKMSAAIDKALNRHYFLVNNIQGVELGQIQRPVVMSGNKVSKSGTQAESWGPLIVGGTLTLLLIFGVSFNSMPVMTMVVNEKASRVYEILLCSLKPLELLWGKVLGRTLVGSLQMLIWMAAFAVMLLLLNNFVDVADAFRMEFNVGLFGYYVVNYIVGLMTFLSLYAGFSVSFEDNAKASSALMPLFLAIQLPFYTVFSLLGNPANAVAQILSITPLTSLYVMPARMSLISVPLWQPLLALLLNLGVLYFAMLAASRIYRIAILSTGNDPSLRQLVTWAQRAG